MKPRVGFIGLGLMGLPMVKHLLNSDYEVSIWNRNKEKYLQLSEFSADFAPTPKALAEKTDILIMCVTDEIAVEDILQGTDGVLKASALPRIVVDHSTISSAAAKKIAQQLKTQGLSYIDAPVTGSVPGAIQGSLVVYAGGEEKAIDEARSILLKYSSRITHMGPAGYGQATKVCNQVMLHNNIVATFETLNLAKNQGLDLNTLLEAFQDSLFDSKAWRIFSTAATEENPKKIAFLKDVFKDLGYIQTAAKNTGSAIPLTKKTAQLVEGLVNQGFGLEDVLKIMHIYNSEL